MKIALCCDHGGLALKNAVVKYLNANGDTPVDFGTTTENSCDYPDFALKAAEAVAKGECERGIFVCTTGIGISIAANKVPGIRCGLCSEPLSAKMTRLHNDANVLALGGGLVGVNLALEIVETFLNTPFSAEEKHCRRIDKITAIERKYSK
jgi:ribose 5-phosphate isomerase B